MHGFLQKMPEEERRIRIRVPSSQKNCLGHPTLLPVWRNPKGILGRQHLQLLQIPTKKSETPQNVVPQ